MLIPQALLTEPLLQFHGYIFLNYEFQWAISITIIKKKTPIYKDIMCIVYQRIKNECLAQANSQD